MGGWERAPPGKRRGLGCARGEGLPNFAQEVTGVPPPSGPSGQRGGGQTSPVMSLAPSTPLFHPQSALRSAWAWGDPRSKRGIGCEPPPAPPPPPPSVPGARGAKWESCTHQLPAGSVSPQLPASFPSACTRDPLSRRRRRRPGTHPPRRASRRAGAGGPGALGLAQPRWPGAAASPAGGASEPRGEAQPGGARTRGAGERPQGPAPSPERGSHAQPRFSASLGDDGSGSGNNLLDVTAGNFASLPAPRCCNLTLRPRRARSPRFLLSKSHNLAIPSSCGCWEKVGIACFSHLHLESTDGEATCNADKLWGKARQKPMPIKFHF